MTTVATRPGATGGDRLGEANGASLLDAGWKMDPVLELWVDVEHVPATVQLAGVLDTRTGASVRSVVEELVEQGHRDLVMNVEQLDVADGAGFVALVDIQRAVQRSGGSITWSHWPLGERRPWNTAELLDGRAARGTLSPRTSGEVRARS